VTAESPGEGRGATLTVRLPLADSELRARPAGQKRSGASGSHVLATLQEARVLVVDDDLDACELLKTALHASGATVCAVQSARAAINAIVSFRPQVLMSDIGMPDEDGYALIRQVRERESSPREATF
jgi:PleD family two-component response regulator